MISFKPHCESSSRHHPKLWNVLYALQRPLTHSTAGLDAADPSVLPVERYSGSALTARNSHQPLITRSLSEPWAVYTYICIFKKKTTHGDARSSTDLNTRSQRHSSTASNSQTVICFGNQGEQKPGVKRGRGRARTRGRDTAIHLYASNYRDKDCLKKPVTCVAFGREFINRPFYEIYPSQELSLLRSNYHTLSVSG